MFNTPISPSLRVFTKNGKAAKDMALHNDPVMVYIPTCLKESLNNIDLIFCNNTVKIDQPIVSMFKRMTGVKLSRYEN